MKFDDFKDFISAISELENEKGMDRETVINALKHGIASAIKRKSDTDSRIIEVEIDEENCTVKFLQVRTVVEEVHSPAVEISLEEARLIEENISVGDKLRTEIDLDSFGRINAQNTKHVVLQQIKEAERANTRAVYDSKRCEIFSATVRDVDNYGNVYVLISNKDEGVIPKDETVQGETYIPGMIIKAELVRVESGEGRNSRRGKIVLSRRRAMLVKRLLELEVPEIQNGIIVIKSIAREPGFKTKVAVQSIDEKIDPVGACLGQGSMRVKNVVNELYGEKIDVIAWDADPATFISNALSPAKVIISTLTPEEKKARVTVKNDCLSLAIGKGGLNARLAAKLTGWKIDITAMSDEFGGLYNE